MGWLRSGVPQCTEQRLCPLRRRVLEVVRLVADQRVEGAALEQRRLLLARELVVDEKHVGVWQQLRSRPHNGDLERPCQPLAEFLLPRVQHRLRADDEHALDRRLRVEAAYGLYGLAKAHLVGIDQPPPREHPPDTLNLKWLVRKAWRHERSGRQQAMAARAAAELRGGRSRMGRHSSGRGGGQPHRETQSSSKVNT
eukprot:2533098-Prymnesium_polylepis.2